MTWARQAFESFRLSGRVLGGGIASNRCCPISCAVLARRSITSGIDSLSTLSGGPYSSRVKPYYVTTPIFYVNADPHIGHLHSDIVADVLTRWSRLRSRGVSPRAGAPGDILHARSLNPVLTTGTDEHGLKMQKVAEALGEHPQKLCDRVSQRFRALADASNINYTRFIRTTDCDHKAAVRHFWKRLEQRGYIYKGSHAGWYAVSDEAFYPEAQVTDVKDEVTGETYKIAIETGQRVEWAEEENYKLKLSEMAPHLLQWLEQTPSPVQPHKYHAQIVAEVKAGLQDLSISRSSSRLFWGIQVPDDASQSIYVWVDALTNYLTATGYPWLGSRGDEKQSAWPADVHVVGKDILRFHAIYWPALLMAAGLELPRVVLTHAHWTKDKSKMSKSRGNVVDPFKALDAYGVDTMRFFLMRVGGNFANDSDYSHHTLLEFHRKCLQGQLGNLLSRVMAPKIVSKLLPAGTALHEDEVIVELARPAVGAGNGPVEQLVSALTALPANVDEHMERFELSKALEVIFEVIAVANEMIQHLQPWSPNTANENVARAVYFTSETLRICGLLLHPFMPSKMEELLLTLCIERGGTTTTEGDTGARSWESLRVLRESIKVQVSKKKVQHLFPKLDIPEES
ncbi:hypothetical protein K437DRAFT_258764 [Tilletiaria anomala UBC 951]|uniref:Probable methionine--tRNA ligase, mitochondrial n=1 Tax=Tilletiaria anomala (strain ATCC 24038 / CBS 436.72 / UBC 951) TaxID=1037660 RepID=A0A066VEJ7_TILAU|nr:uncharacterized protein K437DRAFT_258764 [Tilletiaria anomala UBC 951]KDN40177.1 hypothetical protein K437DRAFT_258764 [Tilletiaria anomala UBC 951]